LLPQPAGSIQEGSIWPESSYSIVNCPVYIAVYRSWDAPQLRPVYIPVNLILRRRIRLLTRRSRDNG
jgi:hypothetical protein